MIGDEDSVRTPKAGRWILGGAAFLLLLSWSAYALILVQPTARRWLKAVLPFEIEFPERIGQLGQVGDSLNLFSSLLSACALVGVLVTLRLQQRQLTGQARQAQEMVLLVRRQQFQEQLFRAIDTYTLLVAAFRRGMAEGREGMEVGWKELLGSLAGSHTAWSGIAQLQVDTFQKPMDEVFRSKTIVLEDAVEKFVKSYLRLDASERLTFQLPLETAWNDLYMTRRSNLDALFRAWYHVYRILETAPLYGIDGESIWLYNSAFRAQVSWIELAYLLVNLSDFPGNVDYDTARRYANKYAIFDNLVASQDCIVASLRASTFDGTERTAANGESTQKLEKSAWDSDAARTAIGRARPGD